MIELYKRGASARKKSHISQLRGNCMQNKKIINMKYTTFVTIVVMMIFVSSSESGGTESCIPIGGKCDAFHSELCSTRYCRNQMCVKFGTVYDDSETTDPCRNHSCPSGQICTYNQVQCFRAPCGPVMGCVDKSSTPCPS